MSAATKFLAVAIAALALIPTEVAVAADATLYELSEEMMIDNDGYRRATSSFQGTAALGTPLCPQILATLLASGDHVVVTDNTYGGTFRLFDKVLTRYDLSFTYVDTSDLQAIETAMRPATRMLFLETPTNPVLRITDLRAACDIAHRHNAFVVVDNTFASPYIQRPIELGADIVVHSTTKFLNGHSDSIGGIVVAVRDEHVEWLRFIETLSAREPGIDTHENAVRCLARPGSRRMALIGNGAQSEFQAIAFHALLGIDEIRAYDVDAAATDKLLRKLHEQRRTNPRLNRRAGRR